MADAEEALARFKESLQVAGLKSTRQRDLIAKKFFELDQHISVEELLTELRKDAPRVGYATVYRTLKILVDHGFANPRNFQDGQTRYDPQYDKAQHDHLICMDCRRIIEFDNPEIMALLRAVSEKHGMTLVRRSLELYGKCSDQAACAQRRG